jgi:DNA-binding response OmpR family regulator
MSTTKVLVVTNDDGFGETVHDFLHGMVEVKIVHTRAEALDCAVRACPDLVMLDHDSADMDCLDMMAITRALRCRFDCVLVTSRPSEHLSHEAAKHGITHLLVKPLDIAVLEELIGVSAGASVQLRSRPGTAAVARM